MQLQSPVEINGPYRHLACALWDSSQSIEALFTMSSDELRAIPLIKLRGKERDAIAPIASYGRGSALARALLQATVPSTVTQRLAFVRLGLDPDKPPSAPVELA